MTGKKPVRHAIMVKRVYDDAEDQDGFRVLVDRLWPRGIAKEAAQIDEWAKELTPSNELRDWFHQDREKRWDEFAARYRAELEDNEEVGAWLQKYRGKSVTLVSSVRDIEHSHVPILRDFLQEQLT